MSHLAGESREQATLLPPVLDDYVAAEHLVRVIDAFVDTLDLQALGFARVTAAATGRPGFAPGALLKLYLYGYLNQVRSSRRLARECERNVEAMWLLHRLCPNFKTVADFRRDHPAAIVGVCRAFTRFCRDQGLLGARVVAVDGSKFGAVASRKRVRTPQRIAREQAAIDRHIEEYLQSLDRADEEEAEPAVDAQAVKTAIEALRTRRQALKAEAAALQAQDCPQRVTSEPEARLMRGAHGYLVAYNAQIAVDEKHHLIVAAEVTNDCNDQRQLWPMSAAAQQALQAETLTVVADTGYINGEQGKACEEHGITPIVRRQATPNPTDAGLFTRERFAYDAASDTYRCPAGQTLSRRRTSQTEQKADYWHDACGGCALKAQCTKAAHRTVTRSFFEAYVEAMDQRAKRDPSWMEKRRCLVEHPFGNLKEAMGRPRFLMRGLSKVRGEFALNQLIYNLKRVVQVLGIPTLLERLKAWRFAQLEAAPT